jgi:two-component system LytT family response regulator
VPEALRVLIVDDEPLARDCVRIALQADPLLTIAAECGDGCEAARMIRKLKPDLVFLDVQMSGKDGLEVIEEVGAEEMPAVVFVTAHDRYAVRAFESHALDYVVKPFENQRLLEAARRARQQILDKRDGELGRKLAALLQGKSLKRFPVRENDRVRFVAAEEVDWIEADGNYVVLHAGAARHRVRETLRALSEMLDPEAFVQAHRSAILNVAHIREMQAWFGGDYIAVMRNGEEVRVSRTYAPAILKSGQQ